MSAVRANLSPVILLYEAGADLPAADLLSELTAAMPDEVAVDDGGVEHRLWAVDPSTVPAAMALLAGASRLPLTIADGHHRYATAVRFCAEVGGAGSDSVLALLFEATSGGLSVLATHRLVQAAGLEVMERASRAFAVAKVTSKADAVPDRSGQIGLWTRQGGARLITASSNTGSSPVAGLDVTALANALPEIIGATVDQLTADDRISYTQDAAEAIRLVDSGAAEAAFLLAPTPVTSVIQVAAAGEVMPPKSTFFYPKAATGLVFNPLVP